MDSTKTTLKDISRCFFYVLISFNTDYMKILRYVTALLQMNYLIITVSSSSKFSFPFGNSVVILFFWFNKDTVVHSGVHDSNFDISLMWNWMIFEITLYAKLHYVEAKCFSNLQEINLFKLANIICWLLFHRIFFIIFDQRKPIFIHSKYTSFRSIFMIRVYTFRRS